jgi:predicted flap endonuclease-1-like 5' DNA nuclease
MGLNAKHVCTRRRIMKWWIWLLLILVLGSLLAMLIVLLWLSRRRKKAVPAGGQATAAPAEPTRSMPQVKEMPATAVGEEAMAKVKDAAAETAARAEETVPQVKETAVEAIAETKETVTEAEETVAEAQEKAADAVAEVEEQAAEAVSEAAQAVTVPMASRMQEAIPVEPPPSDDLKIVEGIGPKISSVLQTAGITTWAQLAATNADTLKQILREANIRLGDPTTWPEQAALAAEEKWDELTTLQDSLKGGRRV